MCGHNKPLKWILRYNILENIQRPNHFNLLYLGQRVRGKEFQEETKKEKTKEKNRYENT